MIKRCKNTNLLAEIWLEASLAAHHFIPPEYWRGNFGAMRDIYLKASENYAFYTDSNEPPVGFISLNVNHIEALFVSPREQGRGFGTALLQYAKSLKPGLTLAVYTLNRKSVCFYLDNGFVETGRDVDMNTGHQEILMSWKKP